jgi:hypothetical protein
VFPPKSTWNQSNMWYVAHEKLRKWDEQMNKAYHGMS